LGHEEGLTVLRRRCPKATLHHTPSGCCCPEDAITDVEGGGVVSCTSTVCDVVEDGVGTARALHSGVDDGAGEETG
jgi:hypothetical protein